MSKWVKLGKYCELTGDTKEAVYQKRHKGIWRDGLHCKIADDGAMWVNTEAVDQWVSESNNSRRKGAPPSPPA